MASIEQPDTKMRIDPAVEMSEQRDRARRERRDALDVAGAPAETAVAGAKREDGLEQPIRLGDLGAKILHRSDGKKGRIDLTVRHARLGREAAILAPICRQPIEE